MKTAEQLLADLVQDGCLIEDAQNDGMRTLPVHAEFVTPAPNQDPPAEGWLYWVEAGAEDQHHTHFRPYAAATPVHDRDLQLTDANGEPVAYVAPLAEWPGTDVQGMKERLAFARSAMEATPQMAAHTEEFIRDCRPDPADALAEA